MYKQPRNLMALSGVALALMALGAPAQADTASPTLNDVRQEVQISTTYALNPYLRSDNLKASVRDGKATLTGKVAEGINKDLANEIARGVDGIKEIDNQIVVDTGAAPDFKVSMAGWGQGVDDATTTVAIKSKLMWSKYVDGLSTTVTTKGGRVTLAGTAASAEAKDLAGRLASNTRGVVSVSNKLIVSNYKPEPAKTITASANATAASAKATTDAGKAIVAGAEQNVSDTWITAKVKSTLLYSRGVAGTDIAVSTVHGEVTLDGQVDSASERTLAIELAKDVRGVKGVQAANLKF